MLPAVRRGRLKLKAGGRLKNLMTIFSSPKPPSIDEYYEPWAYDYEALTTAQLQEHTPVARPKSLISGKDMKISWSANWDDRQRQTSDSFSDPGNKQARVNLLNGDGESTPPGLFPAGPADDLRDDDRPVPDAGSRP